MAKSRRSGRGSRGPSAPAFVSGHPREWSERYRAHLEAFVQSLRLELALCRQEKRATPWSTGEIADFCEEVRVIRKRLDVLIGMSGYDVEELAAHARELWQAGLALTHRTGPKHQPHLP